MSGNWSLFVHNDPNQRHQKNCENTEQYEKKWTTIGQATLRIHLVPFNGKAVKFLLNKFILNMTQNWRPVYAYCILIFRLINDISNVAQPMFMALFSWSCLATCGALLLITMELVAYIFNFIFSLFEFLYSNEQISVIFILQSRNANNTIVEITDPLVMLFLAFTPVAVTCELTGQMSFGFDDIYDEIIKFKWYLWPSKTRKLLLIFLPNAQQIVRFECFGSISSDRDTLKKVCSNKTNDINFMLPMSRKCSLRFN